MTRNEKIQRAGEAIAEMRAGLESMAPTTTDNLDARRDEWQQVKRLTAELDGLMAELFAG